jgi:hypothetical protein
MNFACISVTRATPPMVSTHTSLASPCWTFDQAHGLHRICWWRSSSASASPMELGYKTGSAPREREREIASRTVMWLFIGPSCTNTPDCLMPTRRTVLRWWWCRSNLTVWPWVRARWRLWLGVTTRNVLTSDPQNSSLNHHNGWSLMILWWKIIIKNGASLMTKCDDPTKIVITIYDDIGPS